MASSCPVKTAVRSLMLYAGGLATLFAVPVSAEEEALCAEVVIEIQQEVALERQGFEARMRISNALDTFALENVAIDIRFENADGNPVTVTSDPNGSGAFFFREDSLDGISAVDGTGTIAASSVAEARWLIIPTAGAAGDSPDGELYFVGAELSYTYGGRSQRIEVAPDTIVVRPQPLLTLDYFLTEDVIGDDAFTAEVEPPVPYTLGVRILNNGAGLAKSVSIDSAQPRIVEDEQGLAIGFRILRAFVADAPVTPQLLLAFGDIEGSGVTTGRWEMESSLSGSFIGFDASFTHADELGGALTSLLEAANAHLLIGEVRVDLPGRDGLRDFLVRDGADVLLFESERTGVSEGLCAECAAVEDASATASLGEGVETGEISSHPFQFTTAGGLVYARVPDPWQGTKSVDAVVRSDGRALPRGNAFLTRERAPNETDFEYWLNVFDFGGSGQYEVRFGAIDLPPLAPVFAAVPARETVEGGQVGFLVRATDPNGDAVALSVAGLPSGARFEADGDGEGRFQWFPIAGQAGETIVRFRASDGVLSSTLEVPIRVFPGDDTDGDGLVDRWELDNFGDLSRNGTGDADDDGFSDAEEFENGTDPNVREAVPGDPQILAPAFDAEVTTANPELRLRNAISGSTTDVRYRFELYKDASLTQFVGSASDVPETPESTAVLVDALFLDGTETLEENAFYYWRARGEVTDGATAWVEGAFRVNVSNEPPGSFSLEYPTDGAIVDVLTPVLRVTNPADPEADAITLAIAVFTDDGSVDPVAAIADLPLDESGITTWPPSVALVEDGRYRVEVEATDEEGAATTAKPVAFLVSTVDGAPAAPAVLLPLNGAEVNTSDVRLVAGSVADPEGAEVSYQFEIDSSPAFDSPSLLAFAAADPEIDVPGRGENTVWYWRVRASDGAVVSPWRTASFFVNAVEEAPPAPTLANPGDAAQVEVLAPELSVAPVADPDGDAVSIVFEVYADPELTLLVTSATVSALTWIVDLALDDNTSFYWRAAALDEHGLLGPWSTPASFFVNDDGLDDPPVFTFVLPDADEVSSDVVEIRWTDADPDSSATIEVRAGGTVIASGLPEDPDGDGDRFRWDLANVAPGTYTLEATISDATSSVVEYACCTITVPQAASDAALVVTTPVDPTLDEAGVTVLEVGVSLNQAPAPGETVAVTGHLLDPTEVELVDGTTLSFDETNFDLAQTVSLRGVDDCEIDGTVTSILRLDVSAGAGSAFAGLASSELTLATADNEVAGQELFVCDAAVLDADDAGTHVDYTLRPIIENRGAAIDGASATAVVLGGSQTLIGTATVSFPAVAENASVSAVETIVLRVPPGEALAIARLGWTLDGGGASSPLVGTNANNTLVGTDASEVLEGLGGHDTLRAGGGNDVLIGGPGADTMYGEAGDDAFRIEGNDAHADRVSGGSGFDLVIGGGGDDAFRFSTFSGAFTVERVEGGGGTDRIFGTNANNTLDFSGTELVGIAAIDGLAGHDTITGSAGDDVIVGGPGSDKVRGGGGDDAFLAEPDDSGADRFDGGAGFDTVFGTAGDDALRLSVFSGTWTVERIDGLGGQDVIYGTNANNTLDFSGTELLGIARIEGLGGHDSITGSQGDDVMVGGPGNDTLRGGGGDDVFTVMGEEGADRFDGGAGFDTLRGSAVDDVFRLSVFSGAFTVERIDGNGGVNVIRGTNANNTLDFSATELLAVERIEGEGGHDTIKGSPQADTIVGGPGADSLYGGDGDDRFLLDSSDASADRFSGEGGVDVVEGTSGDDVLRLSVFSGAWTVERLDLGDGTDVIIGTNANNTLDFSTAQLFGVERIEGGAGHDTIKGSSNADVIVGGAGSDSLYGLAGDDLFLLEDSGGRADRFDGGEGIDEVRGTASDDLILLSVFSGSWTVERIDGGEGVDILRGTSANNTLDFSGTTLVGIERIEGSAGHDTITGTSGSDVLVGGPGSDTLRGADGDDVFLLDGSDGRADRFDGGAGTDVVLGSAEDDVISLSVFSGAWTVEAIDGAGGTDVLIGTSANNTLDFSGTTLTGIAEIRGENGHDTIRGSTGPDVIVGGAGSDTLFGGEGDDVFPVAGDDGRADRFSGQEGIDVVHGSAGDDAIRLSVFSGQYVVERIEGGGGSDRILGTSANNTLDFSGTQVLGIEYIDAGPGHDTVRGTADADLIIVGAGSDTVFGGEGNDVFQLAGLDGSGDRIAGEGGDDRIAGTSGDDVLVFSTYNGSYVVETIDLGAGTDRIVGTSANNTLDFSSTTLVGVESLEGGAGHDTVTGSQGDDVIVGGPGNDKLSGRGGSDRYPIAPGEGSDTIREQGDLTGLDAVEFQIADSDALWFYRNGAHLEIHLLGGGGQYVRVLDHFLNDAARIEQVTTRGASLGSAGIDALSALMTDIGRPANGNIVLSGEQADAVAAARALQWGTP